MPDDDVEARSTSLEQEVARLREQIARTSSDAAAARADAAAARVLAAGADRDVSEVRAELRAHTQALNVGPSGIEVAYERFGAPGAPPVLLVMGGGAQMINWPEGSASNWSTGACT